MLRLPKTISLIWRAFTPMWTATRFWLSYNGFRKSSINISPGWTGASFSFMIWLPFSGNPWFPHLMHFHYSIGNIFAIAHLSWCYTDCVANRSVFPNGWQGEYATHWEIWNYPAGLICVMLPFEFPQVIYVTARDEIFFRFQSPLITSYSLPFTLS